MQQGHQVSQQYPKTSATITGPSRGRGAGWRGRSSVLAGTPEQKGASHAGRRMRASCMHTCLRAPALPQARARTALAGRVPNECAGPTQAVQAGNAAHACMQAAHAERRPGLVGQPTAQPTASGPRVGPSKGK